MNITVSFTSALREVSAKRMISLEIGSSFSGRMSFRKSSLKMYAVKFVMMGIVAICINFKEEMIILLEINSLKILKLSETKNKLFI
jgi:hypothetical protein